MINSTMVLNTCLSYPRSPGLGSGTPTKSQHTGC